MDEVLSASVEMEAPDAVVVESRSGLELLERDLPIFAGLRSLIPSGIDFSSLVLCVIEDDQRAHAAVVVDQLIGPVLWQRAILAVGENREKVPSKKDRPGGAVRSNN